MSIPVNNANSKLLTFFTGSNVAYPLKFCGKDSDMSLYASSDSTQTPDPVPIYVAEGSGSSLVRKAVIYNPFFPPGNITANIYTEEDIETALFRLTPRDFITTSDFNVFDLTPLESSEDQFTVGFTTGTNLPYTLCIDTATSAKCDSLLRLLFVPDIYFTNNPDQTRFLQGNIRIASQPDDPVTEEPKKKQSALVPVLITLLVLAICAGIAYIIYNYFVKGKGKPKRGFNGSKSTGKKALKSGTSGMSGMSAMSSIGSSEIELDDLRASLMR